MMLRRPPDLRIILAAPHPFWKATALRYLYVSSLASGQTLSCVADIFDLSRRRNAGIGITGLLLFDGEAFAQWLQGDEAVLRPLVDTIRADPRHSAFRCLLDDAGPPLAEAGECWRAGFAPPGRLVELPAAAEPVQALVTLLPHCDLV